MFTKYSAVVFIALVINAAFYATADPHVEQLGFEQHWEPVIDAVYLQESSRHVLTDSAVTGLAVFQDTLYAVQDGRVLVLNGDDLTPVDGAPGGMQRLKTLNGALWGIAEDGLYRYDGTGLVHVDDRTFVDLTLHRGAVHAATRMDVYRYEDGALVDIKPEGGYRHHGRVYELDDGVQRLPRPIEFGPLHRIASFSDTVYGLRPGALVFFDGWAIEPNTLDWGVLPSRTLRDMLAIGNELYIATDNGLTQVRGMTARTLTGRDGLPYEDITCLAPGFDRDLWIGTSEGAVRRTRDGEYQYFARDRWLPDNHVNAIAAGDQVVYVATDGGLGIIEYTPYTLAKKAAYYERRYQEWGHLRLGFSHPVIWSENHDQWIRDITDNDGGWTAHYLAAMTYKYAATGDEDARAQAVDAFKAMAWLDEMTPMRGYPARSVWSVGEISPRGMTGSVGWPAQWHRTEDDLFEWKGDTSSDEIGAHFYAVSLFHDLAARGGEKTRAAEHLGRIMDHIMDNGWLMRDIDGTPTRWGRWDPEYLQTPYGQYARGLNGMEAQSYVITARAMTGDEKFREGLDQLLEWRYHEETLQQKYTFPPGYVTIWDDRLAWMAYFPMIRYVEDPRLRSVYIRSLERSWEIKRIEQWPWFSFIYGILTGNDCEAEIGVQHLREWPLDLRNYDYRNSHRADLQHYRENFAPYASGDYVQYVQTDVETSPRAISVREAEPIHLSRTTLRLDGGFGGERVTDPSSWLETYWKGRYYGLITPPETDDPALTTVDPSYEILGAAPYDGPPRPEIVMPGE